MNFTELLLIAIALSMDACAVSICRGLTIKKAIWHKAVVLGLYFGFFQAFMPLIGYLAGFHFAAMIESFDHWVAFIVLSFIGGKMIIESVKKGNVSRDTEDTLKFTQLLTLAIATSIDALAVGVSFAFLKIEIISAVILIGITTFVLSVVGVKLGNLFGIGLKSKAESVGGVILILIGLKILLEHLGVISF